MSPLGAHAPLCDPPDACSVCHLMLPLTPERRARIAAAFAEDREKGRATGARTRERRRVVTAQEGVL